MNWDKFCEFFRALFNPEADDEPWATVDKPSPRDITLQGNIKYIKSKKTIEIRNVPPTIWLTTVQDTNSMDPVMDYTHTCILTDNFDPRDLAVGDAVVYRAGAGQILHRIVEIGTDEEGRYYRLKGDNCYYIDPYIVRGKHIRWLLLGVIY